MTGLAGKDVERLQARSEKCEEFCMLESMWKDLAALPSGMKEADPSWAADTGASAQMDHTNCTGRDCEPPCTERDCELFEALAAPDTKAAYMDALYTYLLQGPTVSNRVFITNTISPWMIHHFFLQL